MVQLVGFILPFMLDIESDKTTPKTIRIDLVENNKYLLESVKKHFKTSFTCGT